MVRVGRYYTLLVLLILSLTACDTSNSNNEAPDIELAVTPPIIESSTTDEASTPAISGGNSEDSGPQSSRSVWLPLLLSGSGDDALDAWLRKINNGEIETTNIDTTIEWGLGYFLHYGGLESLALDNLIYRGLVVRRKLDRGEVSEAGLSRNEQNLLTITEGIQHNPNTALTGQIGQTPEIRQAILGHVIDNQQHLSPDEALDSNQIIGVFAPPAPEAIGGKYLVYGQETPDSAFTFLGVIMAVDAAGHGSGETYSFLGWEQLPWLGDAVGPFWNDLPKGVSGDPTNTGEARPGVLLISEDTYAEIMAGDS